MQFPSKVTRFEESSIPTLLKILSIIETCDISPLDLYNKVKRKVNSYDFVAILDSLFALGRVELLEESGVLHYVKND